MQNSSKEKTMVTLIEHLPNELCFIILSYLEAHDLFSAFINLNNYFNQLIASRHLLYKVQFNKNGHSSFISITHCTSNEILNRIISLQWIAKPQYGYLTQFLNKNISKFTRLRALRIEIHPRQTFLICKILPELNSLEYLSVKSVTIETLLVETIFTIYCLHICELINSHVMANIKCSLVGQSNIEVLYLTNISIGIHSITNSFFDHMPKLKRLELYGLTRTFKSLSSWVTNQILIFKKIPITKLKCKSNRITIVFFEQLQPIMSIIKYFSLNIYVDIEDEILLDNLINNWWSVIEQIEKINISFRISKQINTVNKDIQEKFTTYHKMLLSKIDQSNKSCNIKWKQAECPLYKFCAEINTLE
ncbi:unnamed protein product [Rotaria sordida]|uniref:F-box domain-containing protein n=1 Tax=Rotaria sordida TaxID=392033 RepID=A0A818VZ09_9BILA|nr:unnamed protein product [Rotaria sordida]CAF3718020.1 unnamed protein product [Rotaria sordida]